MHALRCACRQEICVIISSVQHHVHDLSDPRHDSRSDIPLPGLVSAAFQPSSAHLESVISSTHLTCKGQGPDSGSDPLHSGPSWPPYSLTLPSTLGAVNSPRAQLFRTGLRPPDTASGPLLPAACHLATPAAWPHLAHLAYLTYTLCSEPTGLSVASAQSLLIPTSERPLLTSVHQPALLAPSCPARQTSAIFWAQHSFQSPRSKRSLRDFALFCSPMGLIIPQSWLRPNSRNYEHLLRAGC